MEYFKKKKKKRSHDAIAPSLPTVQHQKITLRQFIVYSIDRENFNSIDLFLSYLFSNFSHKEGHLSYPGEKPAEFLPVLASISISENSIINRF